MSVHLAASRTESAPQPVGSRTNGADRPPIIVIGSGMTALGVVRILGRGGLTPIAAASGDSILRMSRWYRSLPAGHAVHGRPLADWLADLPYERAVLMPCSDHDVRDVAALPSAMRARFPASVPEARILDWFVDKASFARRLQAMGIAHPFSKVIDDARDLDDVPDAIFASAMLKPRDSQSFIEHFHVKALTVTSRRDAIEQFARAQAAGFPVILQEYIPGPATAHFFVDGFMDRRSAVRAAFVRQRLRMYPTDFGNSTAMMSVESAAGAGAVASITSLLTGAGYRGVFSAEFKRDPRDGIFKILEVNTRPWWYVDFAARCGVDVCRMAYDDALDRPVSPIEHYAVGRRLVFPYYDYFACTALRRSRQLTLWSWGRSWLGAMQPLFQLQDPLPGLRGFGVTMGMFFVHRAARLLPSTRAAQRA